MNNIKSAFIDTTSTVSVSSQSRRRRFAHFLELTKDLQKPLKVLDLGGREQYWKTVGYTDSNLVQVTLFNLEAAPVTLPNFTTQTGSALELPFAPGSFDVIFSNSTIEHVGDWAAQQQMAREIMRVSNRYYIQTPNKYFPIEPHFLFPLFQFLPTVVQRFLLTHVSIGNYQKMNTVTEAQHVLEGVRLLSLADMQQLFPGAQLYREMKFGLCKSITAYNGF